MMVGDNWGDETSLPEEQCGCRNCWEPFSLTQGARSILPWSTWRYSSFSQKRKRLGELLVLDSTWT